MTSALKRPTWIERLRRAGWIDRVRVGLAKGGGIGASMAPAAAAEVYLVDETLARLHAGEQSWYAPLFKKLSDIATRIEESAVVQRYDELTARLRGPSEFTVERRRLKLDSFVATTLAAFLILLLLSSLLVLGKKKDLDPIKVVLIPKNVEVLKKPDAAPKKPSPAPKAPIKTEPAPAPKKAKSPKQITKPKPKRVAVVPKPVPQAPKRPRSTPKSLKSIRIDERPEVDTSLNQRLAQTYVDQARPRRTAKVDRNLLGTDQLREPTAAVPSRTTGGPKTSPASDLDIGQEASGTALDQFFESIATGTGGASRYQHGSGRILDAGTGLRDVAVPSIIPSRYTGESGGDGRSAPSAAPLEDCTDEPRAWMRYQDILKQRIHNNWENPGVSGKHVVILRFTLDRGGTARNVEVISGTDVRVAENAAAAMRRASPFPPIPQGLRCLAGEPLTGKFYWPKED